MESDSQDYGRDAAERYQHVGSVDEEQELVERSVNRWLIQSLQEHLPREGTIGDFGCGSGRLLPMLRGEGRKIVGVDSSREMLDLIPLAGERGNVTEMVSADILEEQLRSRDEFFVCADLQQYLPYLGQRSFRFDAGVSSFNAVCFSHPTHPVKAIRRCLKPSAPLFFTSNVLVPSSALPEQWQEMPVDLSDVRLHRAYPQQKLFRHVLHTRQGDVPLQDHVHHIGMLRDAFRTDLWRVEEARLFPAEGCEHLSPYDRRYTQSYGEVPVRDLLGPERGFTYVKIGVRARKKG